MSKQRMGRETGADVARASFAGEILTAATQADGQFRVKGIANTFTLMRSGRLIHPQAFDKWIGSVGARPDLPFMANHGFLGAADFATIGRVDRVRVDPERGLLFEGWVAKGTPLADQARVLLEQKALRGLSIGWTSRQGRFVQKNEPNIDAYTKQQLEAAGVDEAFVYFGAELVEISAVDVADDPGARLAGRLAAGAGGGPELVAQIRDVFRAEREAERAEFRSMVADLWKAGQDTFIEAIQDAATMRFNGDEYGRMLLDDAEAARGEHGCAAHSGGGGGGEGGERGEGGDGTDDDEKPGAAALARIRAWAAAGKDKGK